jgi:hypothetical protein
MKAVLVYSTNESIAHWIKKDKKKRKQRIKKRKYEERRNIERRIEYQFQSKQFKDSGRFLYICPSLV